MEASSSSPEPIGISPVVARFGPSYLAKFGASMAKAQRDTLSAIGRCRTAASGGHVRQCSNCGVHDYVYHSCGHRGCPKCSHKANEDWLAKRATELLPTSYFHVVLTVPEELRPALYTHQRSLYGVMMKTAARSLLGFFKERYGVDVGVMVVLHTWNRKLEYHPHVHCLVTAGGLTADGDWKPVSVDTKATARQLGARFRPLLLRSMSAAVDGLHHPESAVHRQWHAFVDEARGETQQLLSYLARYVHRTALSDRRVLAIEGDNVRIRYTPTGSTESKELVMSGHEFLRRFLQHVPAKGFHRVRYYGLWSPAKRRLLCALRAKLYDGNVPILFPDDPDETWLECPCCGVGRMATIMEFDSAFDAPAHVARLNPARPPPLALAA